MIFCATIMKYYSIKILFDLSDENFASMSEESANMKCHQLGHRRYHHSAQISLKNGMSLGQGLALTL